MNSRSSTSHPKSKQKGTKIIDIIKEEEKESLSDSSGKAKSESLFMDGLSSKEFNSTGQLEKTKKNKLDPKKSKADTSNLFAKTNKLSRSCSENELDFLKEDLKKESLKLLSSAVSSGIQTPIKKNEGPVNNTSINDFSTVKSPDKFRKGIDTKSDGTLRDRTQKQLTINLDELTSESSIENDKKKERGKRIKRINIQEKQEIFEIKKNVTGPKSVKPKKRKLMEPEENKKASRGSRAKNNSEKGLKVKIDSLLGKFERFKKKMSNLDQKKEIKKIYRSQSSPQEMEDVVTFGRKKEVPKIESASKRKLNEKKICLAQKILGEDRTKKKSYVNKNQPIWSFFKNRNTERRFKKIFSVYGKDQAKSRAEISRLTNWSNTKKTKRKRPKKAAAERTRSCKRRAANNQDQAKAHEMSSFSNKNIFGFNDYSETTQSEEKSTFSGINKGCTSQTINVGNMHWKEDSSGSRSNNQNLEMNCIRPSEISETGSSIFIPKTWMHKTKEQAKKTGQYKSRTGGPSQFKTSYSIQKHNFKESKSMRFLKTFKAALTKNKF